MATETGPRASLDSVSSASTTSLVFERLNEHSSQKPLRANGQRLSAKPDVYTDLDDLDDDDPLKESDANDLETGPFLAGNQNPLARRRPMDKTFRRLVIVVGSVFIAGWVVALFVFVSNKAYLHQSQLDHDPEATQRGSGRQLSLDQVMSGFWQPTEHAISWIAGAEGEDGLLLEQGAAGKDYLVVEDVRTKKLGRDAQGRAGVAQSQTLLQNSTILYNGRYMSPSSVWPSANLKKVLVAMNQKRVWRHSFTALYGIIDVKGQRPDPLDPANPEKRIQLALLSPTSDSVAFVRDNNLFIRKLSEEKATQITYDGGPEYFNGVPDWVYEEEVVGGRAATWWSKDGKYIAFLKTNETGVPTYPIQFFIDRPSRKQPAKGEEAYPEVHNIKYPKAGAHNPVVSLHFYDVERGDVFKVDISDGFIDSDRLVTNVVWCNGQVIVKETNRISDVMRVVVVDVASRTGRTVNTINAGKMDGGWFEISQETTCVPADPANGRPEDGYLDTIPYNGWNHLAYYTPLNNSTPKMLTSGEWEVDGGPAKVDLRGNMVYFQATKASSITRNIYKVNLDGTGFKNITDPTRDSWYSMDFSSGAGYGLLTYGGPNIPWQKVVSTPSNPIGYEHDLEKNEELADRAKKHNLPVLTYGTITVDGVKLNYLERRPPQFDPKKKYPVLFYQYSGPGSQTVMKKFNVDYQTMLASSLGYIVVTVDGRGTGFIGRKNRVLVRQNLGKWEAHDQIEAAKQWAAKPYVDAERMAIWGWSYGGFMTLKVLEQDAGRTFKYGMAVAPVTDWRFYDSVYTERYMKTPQINPVGYEQSAVSNASALGQNVRFLVMHGTGDDNVHYQSTLVLLDKLNLAGIENYDVHVFPDSDHSIAFNNANRIVYDKLRSWLINAFNGEWLKVNNPTPNPMRRKV